MLIAKLQVRFVRESLLNVRCLSRSVADTDFRKILVKQMDDLKSAGSYKSEKVITSAQNTTINVSGFNDNILNFCSNNYLGLSFNEEIANYNKEILAKYGSGICSARVNCGTQDIHKKLENKISHFHQREDTILYVSCFDANAGIFEAVLTPEDAIFSDDLNHASIIDGIRLCKAKKFRYKHRDLNDLESVLKASDARIKFIATDGVFSMDGSLAPLRGICDLAEKYKAIVFVDDCHATGFLGATGRGTEEYFGISGRIDIINSTFGKALGGVSGGYTTGPKELIDLLRQKARPYTYSNALPPAMVATGTKAIDIVLRSSELLKKLQLNTKRFRDAMTKAGFTLSGKDHPICPIMLGDAHLATTFAEKLLNIGIYVSGISYPVVPKGTARIRAQLSAGHSFEDVDKCVSAFVTVGRELQVI